MPHAPFMNPASFDGWTIVFQWINMLIAFIGVLVVPIAMIFVIVLLKRIARNTEPKGPEDKN